MEYREIGRDGIKISEVSLGCWTMAGPNWRMGKPIGWAEVDEEEVTRAVKEAIDAGVNHFDNADDYGAGRAERMLARCLDRLGLRSEDYVIASKVGHFKGCAEHAYEPAHIRHQCEQSLINLKRDYLDIYYFHHGDFGEDRKYLSDAVDVMNRLVEQGKVRTVGLSAYSDKDFEELVPVIKPGILQSWGNALQDNFIHPDSPLQRLMAEHDLKFVAFSPLAQGQLLDKFDPENPPEFPEGDNRRGNPRFSAEALRELKPKLEMLKQRFGSSTEDLAAVALRFVLEHPRIACVIPGFRNTKQVRANLGAADRSFTEEDVQFIRQTLGD